MNNVIAVTHLDVLKITSKSSGELILFPDGRWFMDYESTLEEERVTDKDLINEIIEYKDSLDAEKLRLQSLENNGTLNKIFLGGTCSDTKQEDYRSSLISHLENLNLDYFDPHVDEWDDNARQLEEDAKRDCRFDLFLLDQHKMKGVYSILEMTISAIKRGKDCIIYLVLDDGDEKLGKNLTTTVNHLKNTFGATVCVTNSADYVYLSGVIYAIMSSD